MATYHVPVTLYTEERVIFVVDADNEEEAADKAIGGDYADQINISVETDDAQVHYELIAQTED